MTAQRSVLLNHELPPALSAGLIREGVNPSGFWLSAETDLNLSGSYEPVYLVADEERIECFARFGREGIERQDFDFGQGSLRQGGEGQSLYVSPVAISGRREPARGRECRGRWR